MTYVLEVPVSEQLEAPQLGIEGKSPNLQYQMLGWDFMNIARHIPGKEARSRALFSFGADETSSESLMVRAFALERGMCTLRSIIKEGGELPADLRRMHEFVQSNVPEYFDHNVTEAVQQHGTEGLERAPKYWGAHNWVWHKIAQQEGILEGLIFDKGDPGGGGTFDALNHVPVAVGLLLDHHVEPLGEKPGASRGIAPELMHDAVRLTVEQVSAVYKGEALPLTPEDEHLLHFLRLGRFIDSRTETANYEHDGPAEYLYRSPESVQYAEVLNRLYESAPAVTELFSTMDPQAVTTGFRGLMANAMFALQYFLENGNKIDITIPSRKGEPTRIYEEDPHTLLTALADAIAIANHAVNADSALPVFEAVGEGVQACRFVPHEPTTPAQVSWLGRSKNGGERNPLYEFSSRPTIRYRIQLDTVAPISLLNSKQTANTVTLRTDYDDDGATLDVAAFRQNPYTENGLDLEIRLGRFLAVGNWLRSQMVDTPPSHHHVRGVGSGMSSEDMAEAVHLQARQLRTKRVAFAAAQVAADRN